MSGLDIYDLPKSLETSLSPPPPIILPNPQVQGHSSPIGKQGLCMVASWR